MTRVVVIGGGMAGGIAALAARDRGADVTLVRRAWGATAVSSGAIDVAADPLATPEDPLGSEIPILAAAEELSRLRPAHPYAVLHTRLESLTESLQFAHRALQGLVVDVASHNRQLATPLGTAKPAAMAQSGMASIDLGLTEGVVGVVHFDLVRHFDGPSVAAGLTRARARLGRAAEAVPIPCSFFNHRDDAILPLPQLAARIESDPDGLAKAVKVSSPSNVAAFLFPPFLANETPGPIVAALEKALAVPCGETVSGVPSLPGLRLQRAIDGAVEKAGVRIVTGDAKALGFDGPIQITGPAIGETLAPDAVVLATGKYIGRGILRDEAFSEPVFGLPVHSPQGRLDLQFIGDVLDRDAIGEHDAFRAGVLIDSSLRALGSDGKPVSPRLFAAGSVVSGYDPAKDKTGLGVAIFTGYLAGRAAAGGV